MAKWIVAEKAKAGLRHAIVCPDVTGTAKERKAQSKRARGKPKASGLMLVRSPLLTSHNQRELVSFGRLVCRCHGIFGKSKASGLVLVRSPLLTSHNQRELVSSGRLVCRCHGVFLWCYVCFVLHRFRLYGFVEAAVLRSIVLRYAGAPIATRVSFFPFVYLEISLFPSIFVSLPLSLCMEGTSYVLSFRMVVFYLVIMDWIFGISLCRNSIKANQSIVDIL